MVTSRRARTGILWSRAGLVTAAGYSLVVLVIIVAIMNVLVAASLPAWSHVIRRDKEAELIFRGLQYAEAIRIFQLRFGRLPVRLEELIEVKPRSIRQLWRDPMTDSGEWDLLHGQQLAQPQEADNGGRRSGQRRRNRRRREARQSAGTQSQSAPVDQADSAETAARRSRGNRSDSGPEVVGPVIGVHSKSLESGARVFMGSQVYGAWLFTAELLTLPRVTPDGQRIVGSKTDWIGRPFPEGLGPEQGDAGEELSRGRLPGGVNRRR